MNPQIDLKLFLIVMLILVATHSNAKTFSCPANINFKNFSLHHLDGETPVLVNQKKTLSLAVGCEDFDKLILDKSINQYKELGFNVTRIAENYYRIDKKIGKTFIRMHMIKKGSLVFSWSLSSNDLLAIEFNQKYINSQFKTL